MKESIASDALKLSISKIITTSITLVTAMLLSRFTTLEEYGTYSQLLVVINIFTTIFMLGLPNSINFFLAKTEDVEEKQKFVSTYYTLSTILSIITGLVLVLSTPLIVQYFKNPMIKSFWYFLAVFPWTKIILVGIENFLVVYKKAMLLMIFRIVNSVLIVSAIVLANIFGLGFNAYIIIYIIIEAMVALSVYVIVKKVSGTMRFHIDKTILKNVLKFSIPIGLAATVGLLNVQLDKLLIGRLFSTDQLAIYTNAAKELPLSLIAVSITAVLMPQLVRLLKEQKNKEAIDLWSDATTLSYIFICFFSGALIVFAPEVITILYSAKYLPGVSVFRVYSIVLLLRCTYFGIILNSIGKTKLILYSSIAALGINIILNIICYYIFGFIGPAIATFVSISMVAIFQLIATAKSIDVRFKNVFPWKNIGIATAVNIVLGVIFMLVKNTIALELFGGEIIESVILGIIWGGIYMLIMFKTLKQKWHLLNT